MSKRSSNVYISIVLVTLGGLLAFPPTSPYWRLMVNEIAVFGLLGIAFDVCLGFTGMLNFGIALYFGSGAYLFLWALQDWKLSISMAIFVAVFGTFLLAVLTGFLAVRLKGPAFFVMTLIFVTAAYALSQNWKSATGGDDGITLDASLLSFLGQPLEALPRYRLGLFIFLVCFLATIVFVRSPMGRLFMAIKENEFRMELLGYDAKAIKLAAFSFSGIICSLAGVCYALAFLHVHTGLLHGATSANTFKYAFFGGMGTLVGPVLGVILLIPFEDFVSARIGFPRLFTGILLVAIILVNREGLIGIINAATRRPSGARRGR